MKYLIKAAARQERFKHGELKEEYCLICCPAHNLFDHLLRIADMLKGVLAKNHLKVFFEFYIFKKISYGFNIAFRKLLFSSFQDGVYSRKLIRFVLQGLQHV